MTLWVQSGAGNLSTMTWYRGDEIENDVNYWWPFNNEGYNKGYMEIKDSTSPLYIRFTPLNNTNLLGVILAFHLYSNVDYNRDITVELEESTDGGLTWTSVRSKTLNFPTDVNMGPVKQYGKYMIDFRFDLPYPVLTTNLYRFKIYRSSTGTGTVLLELSMDSGLTSRTTDVTDWAFRIIYSDTTGTPLDTDVFVITDELVIDQNWTVGYVTIPTTPTKDRLDSYNNKGSLWMCSKGRVYVPSTITTDITVEIKGRMYIGGGDRVAWQIGDSETSPVPSSVRVNWFFNCEGISKRAGIYGYWSSWTKIEHYGSEITNWYGVLKYYASAGQNQIVVEGDVTSEWQVGDQLRIGATRYSDTRHLADYTRDHVYYTITAISYDAANDETTITLNTNLAYPHDAGGRVLLIRRNVHVYGDVIATTTNRADCYMFVMRWWKCYWVRYSYMNYPICAVSFYSRIPLEQYPHRDVLVGVLVDNCHYVYFSIRRDTYIEKFATCDSRSSWNWGDGSVYFHKNTGGTIKEFVGIVSYFVVALASCYGVEVSDFWVQGNQCIYLSLSSKCKIHDGEILNSRHMINFLGSSDCEIYNIVGKNIYYDSNHTSTTLTIQGCFAYTGDIISTNNYIHDVSIENAFTIIAIDVNDGSTDWYHNITWTGVTVDIWETNRADWLEQTRIRFTNWQGVEDNDYIIFKYGIVHKTGNYAGADDTTYRVEGGKNYAIRLEPQVDGEEFKEYSITLTGCKANKPVFYLGYIYVNLDYFAGTDVINPEIYIEGLGIDYNAEPTAKWIHPGSAYAGRWVPFMVTGTPTQDGNATVKIKVKSDGAAPYVYIDDDLYSWAEPIDYRSHEVWIDGQPANPPAIFPVITPMEVWNVPVAKMSETSTMGRLIAEHTGIVAPRRKIHQVNQTVKIIFSMESENSHTVKINIYDSSGTKVVDSMDMIKIGTTRYYYYDWLPNAEGTYIVECYVDGYAVKDSMVLEVVPSATYLTANDVWSHSDRTLTHSTLETEGGNIAKKEDVDNHDKKMTAFKFMG